MQIFQRRQMLKVDILFKKKYNIIFHVKDIILEFLKDNPT